MINRFFSHIMFSQEHCRTSSFHGLCLLKPLVFPSEPIKMPPDIFQSIHAAGRGTGLRATALRAVQLALPLCWASHAHSHVPSSSLHLSVSFSKLSMCLSFLICLEVSCSHLASVSSLCVCFLCTWILHLSVLEGIFLVANVRHTTQTGSHLCHSPKYIAFTEKSRCH